VRVNCKVNNADVIEWCRNYKGEPFHSILCDPPYHLTSNNSQPGHMAWKGATVTKLRQEAKEAKKAQSGFMGKEWDGGDVAFRPETWQRIMAHLHPGGFLMAFASARGWHRMACAIEDAGFVIHPSMFLWLYASGFPKSSRIGERYRDAEGKLRIKEDERFASHRYGLQLLKPAAEPIIVAQKPYVGKPVDCITKTGAGALNVDGGRIGTGDRRMCGTTDKSGISSFVLGGREETRTNEGRWPANFLLCCESGCADGKHVESCPSARLDRQSGERPAGKWNRTDGARPFNNNGKDTGYEEWQQLNDEGGASRYFFRAVADAIDDADPVRYVAKASRRERDAGCEGLPMRNTCEHDGRTGQNNSSHRPDGSERQNISVHNSHPTVKPISLARYLSALLLPPAEYAPRRILIPFSGSGSEMIGAMQAGWEEVVGIEMDPEYVKISEARIKHELAQVKQPQEQELVMA